MLIRSSIWVVCGITWEIDMVADSITEPAVLASLLTRAMRDKCRSCQATRSTPTATLALEAATTTTYTTRPIQIGNASPSTTTWSIEAQQQWATTSTITTVIFSTTSNTRVSPESACRRFLVACPAAATAIRAPQTATTSSPKTSWRVPSTRSTRARRTALADPA